MIPPNALNSLKNFLRILLLIIPVAGFGQSEPLWKSKYDTAQLLWKNNITKSLALLTSAEKIAFDDLGIYDDNYLTILNDIGLANGELKDYKAAEDYLVRNIKIQREVRAENDIRVLQSQCNLATIYLKSGKDQRAKKIYREVLNQSLDSEDGTVYFVAAENLIRLYEDRDQLDSAMIVVRKALSDHTMSVANSNELRLAESRVLRKSGRFEDSRRKLATLSSDIATYKSSPTLSDAVKLEQSLINVEMGSYGVAEKDLLQLYRTLKAAPDQDDQLLTETITGLAYAYEKMGIYDKAIVYYEESLNRCVSAYGYNSLHCLIIQNNMAGIYLRQGQVKPAIAEYERFIAQIKGQSNETSNLGLTAYNNLATAYRQAGQYDRSLEQLRTIYKILSDRHALNDDLAAAVMSNIAVAHTMQGKYDIAAGYFQQALTIKQNLFGKESPMLLDVTGNLAVAYWAMGQQDKAIPLFRQSQVLARHQVRYLFPGLTEPEQVQFYEQQKQNFERFNTLVVQSGSAHPELLTDMFNNQLLLKSLVFFTNKKRNTIIAAKNNPKLKELNDLVQMKETQLGHAYQLPQNQLEHAGTSIAAIEHQIDSLEKIIRHGIHEENNAGTIEWKNVQQSLQKNEALVEMIRFRKYDLMNKANQVSGREVSIGFTDSVYYAALITTAETNDHPTLVVLKNGSNLERRFLGYYRNTLKYDFTDTISYNQFWLPLEAQLTDKHRIYFAADGVYHRINLNSMRSRSGKYLIERYDLHPIMNSAQLVTKRSPVNIDFDRIELYGDANFGATGGQFDPLPGTRQELEGIIDVLKLNRTYTRVFMKTSASEENLRKASSPSILHIASHGFFSPGQVYLNDQAKNNFLFYSGLVLSAGVAGDTRVAGTDHDGIVTAYDVMNLDLASTDLVVLSACETGLGKIENSEGVYGLQRSFLQAGAKNLLVSLWKVDDAATRDLMVKFYSYLEQHDHPREAFELAQLDMLRTLHNPRLWAGFVMVGD